MTTTANSPYLASVHALHEIAALAEAPLRWGHSLRILRDGALAFPAMLAVIRSARESVCFENFIMADDETGRPFTEALIRAERRGVRVQVLYDPLGTMLVRGGSVRRRLRAAGLDVRPFRPLSPVAPWSWLRLWHRDHRKLLIADGRFAVVGGICIANHWAPRDLGGSGWRDTAVLVRGPAVADLQVAFDRMWKRAHGSVEFPTLTREHSTHGLPEHGGEVPLVVVGDRPGTLRVATIYEWLADHAEQSIELTDAYFVAPRRVLTALVRARQRGVSVRLLLPGRNNHPIAGLAARRIYAPLLEAGAEIYEWGGVMLHAKTIVVDGLVSMVGSSNLDPLSLHRNYELNILGGSPTTGAAMRDLFAQDLRSADRVTLEEWRKRPLSAKLAEAAASVFSTYL